MPGSLVDCGVSGRSPVPVGAVVARPAVGSTDRGGVTWRAPEHSLFPVRPSSFLVTSCPSSSSEEERAESPPPTVEHVPSGTPSVSRPAPAGDHSTRLALWACSCGLLLRQIGLTWILVVFCPLLLRVEQTLTILVSSALWTLTGFLPVCPGPHVELP